MRAGRVPRERAVVRVGKTRGVARAPVRARRRRGAILCLVLLTLFGLRAEVLTGRVVKVSDGDTITLLDATNAQSKIRLNGIDAPEKSQAFGEASR